mmetsp:Transcript_66839/g.186775  ORF Transcript_66839/g.186775 Transcript_66839/m.186775 type:complete len:258 (-) Transcript_66839:230-1003(-)
MARAAAPPCPAWLAAEAREEPHSGAGRSVDAAWEAKQELAPPLTKVVAPPSSVDEDLGASTDSGSEKAERTPTSGRSTASCSDEEEFAESARVWPPPPPMTPPPPAPAAARSGAPPGLEALGGLAQWHFEEPGEAFPVSPDAVQDLPEQEGKRRGAELMNLLFAEPTCPQGGRKLAATAPPFVPKTAAPAAVEKPFEMKDVAAAQPFVPKPQQFQYLPVPGAWGSRAPPAAAALCWDFASFGACPRGGACRWLHVAQ